MNATPLLEPALARRLDRLTFVTRRRLAGQGHGDRRSLRKGSSLEFADFRPYTPGDDPNRVDWNLYARTGSLFVRVYEAEEVLNVHLLVDVSGSMDWGEPNKLAYAQRVAAGLGYVALSSASRLFVWPLEARAGSFGPAWGRPRASALLAYLGVLRPAREGPPGPLPGGVPAPGLEQSLASSAAGVSGLLVLVSDLLTPTWERVVARLAGRGEVVVLHTLAPQELRPALGGDVRLIDRETGASVSVTLNDDALRLYRQRLEAWQASLRSTCLRYGVAYVPVDTSTSVETLLLDTLRQRGVVR